MTLNWRFSCFSLNYGNGTFTELYSGKVWFYRLSDGSAPFLQCYFAFWTEQASDNRTFLRIWYQTISVDNCYISDSTFNNRRYPLPYICRVPTAVSRIHGYNNQSAAFVYTGTFYADPDACDMCGSLFYNWSRNIRKTP